MRCPTLGELPPSPPGKTGWPWTIETPPSPAARPDGSPWPRISIVTPSYNQGQFIEETIRSVLLQGYPELEYIIIDGGSVDDSIEIIRKYEPWLTYWVSEKDRGQAHAINKGFSKATGIIGAYLNSDDFYLPDALRTCADSFIKRKWQLFIGMSDIRRSGFRKFLQRNWWLTKARILPIPFVVGCNRYTVSQESTFWSLEIFATFHLDESLLFCMDVDWYCKIARGSRIVLNSRPIGHFRQHSESKSATLQKVAKSEIGIISARERIRGIDVVGNAAIFTTYRRRLPVIALKKLLFGEAEFAYTHPK